MLSHLSTANSKNNKRLTKWLRLHKLLKWDDRKPKSRSSMLSVLAHSLKCAMLFLNMRAVSTELLRKWPTCCCERRLLLAGNGTRSPRQRSRHSRRPSAVRLPWGNFQRNQLWLAASGIARPANQIPHSKRSINSRCANPKWLTTLGAALTTHGSGNSRTVGLHGRDCHSRSTQVASKHHLTSRDRDHSATLQMCGIAIASHLRLRLGDCIPSLLNLSQPPFGRL